MKTTLFMLMSVDGKISTGANDDRDFDKDFPNLSGIAEGLNQYYALETQTDLFSFNTGRVMAKVGWNDEKKEVDRLPVSFVIVDNRPHLTTQGVENLIRRCEKLYLATSNEEHPASAIKNERLELIPLGSPTDLKRLFGILEEKGVDSLTIQSGGEMNAVLLREGLINQVSIVVAPALVGGRSTPTLIDGESLVTFEDLQKIRALNLVTADKLNNSYLYLLYEVLNC